MKHEFFEMKELKKYLVKKGHENKNAPSEMIFNHFVLSRGFPAFLAALHYSRKYQSLSKI